MSEVKKLTVEDIRALENSLTPVQNDYATMLFIASGWGPGDYIPLYICRDIFSRAALPLNTEDQT